MELLTVIGIIAVLAGLISSALNHTRNSAHQVSCLNNLKQIQVAWYMYADDSGDELPLNTSTASPSTKLIGMRNTRDSWVAGNPKEDTTTANLERGSLFPYLRNAAVFRCPSDRSTVIQKKWLLRNRSFSMSAYMNGDQRMADPRVKTKFSDLTAPDRLFVLIEEHEQSVWMGAFIVMPKQAFGLANSGNWRSTPSGRHDQGCNLSFADGHIEHWRWYSPKSSNLDNLSVLSNSEARDLRRLQEAIPKP